MSSVRSNHELWKIFKDRSRSHASKTAISTANAELTFNELFDLADFFADSFTKAGVSADYLDLDFGSFAGEDFDISAQDVGAALGVRTLIKDKLQLSLFGRYTNVGDVLLNEKAFDSDVLVGAGFGIELIRGLSITGELESGEQTRWPSGSDWTSARTDSQEYQGLSQIISIPRNS